MGISSPRTICCMARFNNINHYVGEPGHYGLLLMRIAQKITNGTTLVHDIYELVGKYIMEQCDVDLCYSFIESNIRHRVSSSSVLGGVK